MRTKTLTDKTVLEVLAQIAGGKAKGQQPEPPWFHPFPARMPLSVAEHLISRITTREAVILDPMVGSGTSVIAARRFGRYGLGFDRDPLAILIARSAVASFDEQRLERVGAKILDRAMRFFRSEAVRVSNRWGKMPPEDRRFVDYWFPPQSQEQLFALARAIKQEANGAEKDFAWVVFSSLIIAKFAGASFALDLPRSRPHKRPDKVVVLPLEAWSRRFRAAVARLPFKDRKPTMIARILHGDARNLPLEDRTIDFVLTSPPYLNGIDYLRAHKFSLVWMGYNLEQLRELRGTMVGTERGLWTLDGLPRGLESRLADLLEQHRDRAQRRRYLSDLGKVMAEIARVLRPGGLALLVVGPTIISSKRSDAPDVLGALGQRVGLRLVGSIARELRAAHRSLPPPTLRTGGPLSDRMRREVIVALRKQSIHA